MDKKQLAENLSRIKVLAEESLRVLGRAGGYRAQTHRKGEARPTPAKTLPDHILILRDRGFFKQVKTPKEVHSKIQASYPCDLDRVVMALLRLQRRKLLRKAFKQVGKKRLVAYVW